MFFCRNNRLFLIISKQRKIPNIKTYLEWKIHVSLNKIHGFYADILYYNFSFLYLKKYFDENKFQSNMVIFF